MNFHIEIKKHFDIIAKNISKRKNEYQKWINKNYSNDMIGFGWDISNNKNPFSKVSS